MDVYDPSIEPDKDVWLATEESERLDAVMEFHENNDEDLDDNMLTVHSVIHVVVENQLAMGVEHVPETMAKLRRQGLSRHEAIHAIGAIVAEDSWAMIRGETTAFSPKRYRRQLEKLTAKRWRKGLY